MKKYLSIILSLLFLILSLNVDAHRRRHHYIPKKKARHSKVIRVARAPKMPRVVEGICGLDVSHYQGTIDWNQVEHYMNNKISFVYVKATEGGTIKDEYYERNIQHAKEKGILVGSYHYFTTRSSAEVQFENFKQSVNKGSQDLIPVVDIEECEHWTPEMFHMQFQIFLNELETYYGQKPIIYTMSFFYNLYLADHYTGYKIFVAQYGEGKPVLRDGNEWKIWQFTHTGRVDGIRGYVDVNLINPNFTLNDVMLTGKKEEEKVIIKDLKPNSLPQ